MNLSISVATWFLYYAGFYLMQILLAWYTVGSFRWQTLTLATVSFPIYIKALLNVIKAKDVGWQATGTARGSSPFNFIIPQVLFFVFLFFTSLVAIWRDVDNGLLTLATAWNLTNTVILGGFMLTARREARALRKGRSLAGRMIPDAGRLSCQLPSPSWPGTDSAVRRWCHDLDESIQVVAGLIVVLAITAGATLVFSQRQTHVTSTTAQIAAQLHDVGTDYGGIVDDSFVKEGDAVVEGQRMFVVRSLQLERDIATGSVAGSGGVDPGGHLGARLNNGIVSTIDLSEGSYVAPGSVLATIDAAGSLYAHALFILTPRDFARIDDGAAVTLRLPDETS